MNILRSLSITAFIIAITPSLIWAEEAFSQKLAKAAKTIVNSSIIYDGRYVQIPYPNGDVDPRYGVCSDVIIRSYRKLNIDLQKLVHEDMKQSFNQYPSKKMWGLNSTDRNIDHRRVPNLERFFERHGTKQVITKNPQDYHTGDIISWRLDNGLPHIGIIVDERSSQDIPLVLHNIGYGQVVEDVLFSWKIVGHYMYEP